jgi:tRNA(fMet)-specific endonuclease VapC
MMKALIDTDILSYFLRGQTQVVASAATYLQHHEHLCFSAITYYEILSGLAFKSALQQMERFEKFAAENAVIYPTRATMQRAAHIYAETRRQGTPVDDMDLLIASIALELDYVLVTNNTQHFTKIPGLIVQNWCAPEM